MQFINSLLNALGKNLNDIDLKHLVSEFGVEKLELQKEKDACPYEYMNCQEKIDETSLPDKRWFYSYLKDGKVDKESKWNKAGFTMDGHISDKKYLHCQKVWKEFEMKTLRDFHDHYLRQYVLLLADVFEKLIGTCMKYYGLDPCQYFSAPGLSWDAMLKMFGVELQKLDDTINTCFLRKV